MKYKLDFWKPRRENNGAAAFFEFNMEQDNPSAWFTMMPESSESGNSKFDSNRKIVSKLNLEDLGQILAVLTGRLEGLGDLNDKGHYRGLYHQGMNGASSTIGLSYNSEYKNFNLSLTRKDNSDAEPVRYYIGLSHGQAEQLRVFCENVIGRMMEELRPPTITDNSTSPKSTKKSSAPF